MSEDLEYDDELVRLSEIFDTLRKDALEVSDLLVKGITYRGISGVFQLGLGIVFLAMTWRMLSLGDVSWLSAALFPFITALVLITGAYDLYKHRRLKKKYAELIEIQKSLAEN